MSSAKAVRRMPLTGPHRARGRPRISAFLAACAGVSQLHRERTRISWFLLLTVPRPPWRADACEPAGFLQARSSARYTNGVVGGRDRAGRLLQRQPNVLEDSCRSAISELGHEGAVERDVDRRLLATLVASDMQGRSA